MPVKQAHPRIPLPRNWHSHVKSAVLHTISLAHFAVTHARGMATAHTRRRVRLAVQNERLQAECALLREEIRIKDARMDYITPHRRPRYGPFERMAILESARRPGLVAEASRVHLPGHGGDHCFLVGPPR